MNEAQGRRRAGLVALVVVGVSAIVVLGAAVRHADKIPPRTPMPRVGANLVANPEAHGPDPWALGGDAAFDRTRTRSRDRSGSFRLVTPLRDDVERASRVLSPLVAVRPGADYSFSFYLKSKSGPSYVWSQVAGYDGDRRFVRNLRAKGCGTARDGFWEECVLPLRVPPDVAFVRLEAVKGDNPAPGGRAWIDELYFGEELGFEQPPSTKSPFAGTDVRIDALGNFEVRRDGEWEPFFVLGIYADPERDWSVYARQGFNTIMRVDDADQMARARDAVSGLNPDGLLAGFSITPYLQPGSPSYSDLKALRASWLEVARRDLSGRVLFFHWDNERHHGQWSVPARVIRGLRRLDADSDDRRRPIYALQGTFGIARTHAARGLVDVSGTYVGGGAEEGDGDAGMAGFVVLDRLEGQTSPAAIAQFNQVRGPGDLRLRLYNSILVGARGAAYWRDCHGASCRANTDRAGPIDAEAWWDDVPRLRREIDRLGPLLRRPHWTDWSAVIEPTRVALAGSRELDGEGYVIVVNQTSVSQDVTVRIDRLPYRATVLVDLFSGERIVGEAGGWVVRLAPIGVGSGTRVLRLADA